MEKVSLKQSAIRGVSIGLFALTVLMTHFIFFIHRYESRFSEETIFGLYLWSWLPSLANCIYCAVFFRDLPWWLKLAIIILPLIQVLAFLFYTIFGFDQNWRW